MDSDTKQWIITVASVVLAPVLTYLVALRRVRSLDISKSNMMVINERAEFRKDQQDKLKRQDEKIELQDERLEEMRRMNNKLYGRVMYLEAVMKAKGIEFEEEGGPKLIDYEP